jgi:SAM-dependent methyltransferase
MALLRAGSSIVKTFIYGVEWMGEQRSEELSSTYLKEGLLSPYLRKKRTNAALPYLQGKILDFGSGLGGLASLIPEDRYTGLEVDGLSRGHAESCYPKHTFISQLPGENCKFDTIVALAAIEHIGDQVSFLRNLVDHLEDTPESCIVLTTPHPFVDWVHHLGAAVGIFSKCASDEHEELLDHAKLKSAGDQAGLTLVSYSRFLFGANQLAVYRKKGAA